MIHLREEGSYLKIGLNLCFARNLVTMYWVWFDFARHEGSSRGFTISRRGLRYHVVRWNVVDEYLKLRNLSIVCEEELQDMRLAEQTSMRVNERYSLIKPGRAH